MNRLLFRKNKLLHFNRHSGHQCPGYEKCLHPGSVKENEVNMGLKDEPRIEIIKYCRYQKYIGPNSVVMSEITKAEYEKMIQENTMCWHHDELKPAEEWRCYKCDGIVKSERERCQCH